METIRDIAVYYASRPDAVFGSGCVLVREVEGGAMVHFRCHRRSFMVPEHESRALREWLESSSESLRAWYSRRAGDMLMLAESDIPGHTDFGFIDKQGGVWRGKVCGAAISIDMLSDAPRYFHKTPIK